MVLVASKVIDETELTALLAEQLGIPVVDLRERAVAPEAVSLVSEMEAHLLEVLPLSFDGSMICSTVPPSVHPALSTAGATVKAFAAVTACQTLLPSGAKA